VARALVNQVNFPITGASANLSRQPGCTRIEDLAGSIRKNADLILDAGPVKGGIGSTIVDVTQTRVAVLRQGEISKDQIHQVID
jgi:L-threonylcarbamoyladenylate synthase